MFKAALLVLVTRMTPICENLMDFLSTAHSRYDIPRTGINNRLFESHKCHYVGLGCPGFGSGVSVRGDQGLPCAAHRQFQLISDSFKCTTEQPLDKA